jgi:hypothetical protein
MRAGWLLGWSLVLIGCAAASDDDELDDQDWLDGKSDGASAVDIAATHLDVDLATTSAVATLELEKGGNVALEAGGLTIDDVTDDRGHRRFSIREGKLLVSRVRGDLVVHYRFAIHDHSDGLLPGGSTLVWPYFCGNLFPCHSAPVDGTAFTLSLANVPADATAVFAPAVDAAAPSYMLAWAVGAYTRGELGTTTNGTRVGVYWLPGGETAAKSGTRHLRAVFDFYEQTLGPYAFGDDVASVSAAWGPGAFGGMEHHPFWHVAKDAMADELTHAHEAAHGWFGDGVRLRCWEDFVLSEGTVSYLAARALAVASGPTKEAQVWAEYKSELDAAIDEGGAPAWPRGCNQIDILEDKLFTNLPYMQGAFFYKDVAEQVGVAELDAVIGRFYRAHVGQAASMQDMLDAIAADTGFDATQLAEARLRTKF